MLKIKDFIPIELKLFHVNYNMHSKSKIMSDYCSKMAKKNNLEIFIQDFDSKNFNSKNIESQAREYRYNKLRSICLNNEIQYILTAHHEDDQIETVYMAQKNNSSWVSKIGIRSKYIIFNKNNIKISLIRPMLDIPKDKISDYINKNKLLFFDDPTNQNIKFLRNKIRIKINSKISDTTFRRKYLNISKENKIKLKKISTEIDKDFYKLIFLLKSNDICILNRELFIRRKYEFIFLFFKKILREQFNFNQNLSSDYWKNLYDFIKSNKIGNNFILNNLINISKSKNHIYIYNNFNSLTKTKLIDLGNYFFRLGTISISKSNQFIKFKNKEGISIPFDFNKNLEVNKWKHGDKCISSKDNQINVSDLFINNKLSLFHKENYPLVKYLDRIIWIPCLFYGKIDRVELHKKYLILRWNLNL